MGKKHKRKYDPALVPKIPSRWNGMRWTPEGEAIRLLEEVRFDMLKAFAKRIDKLAADQFNRIATEDAREEQMCTCFDPNEAAKCPLHPHGYAHMVGGVVCHTEGGTTTMMNVRDPDDEAREQYPESMPVPECIFANCHELAVEGGFTCAKHTKPDTPPGARIGEYPVNGREAWDECHSHPFGGLPNEWAWIEGYDAAMFVILDDMGVPGHTSKAEGAVLTASGCTCEALGIGKPRYDADCPLHGRGEKGIPL